MIIHINEIKLNSDTAFAQQFNKCSDYCQKWNDESLSKEEQERNFDLWFEERNRLELGLY